MPGFIIERTIPDIGTADRDAAIKSNSVLRAMQTEGKNICREHSFVANDKTVCVYRSDGENSTREHAERSGFPATAVTEVRRVIDPLTAESAGK